MPGRPMTEEQKRKKRERERERQNGTPVIKGMCALTGMISKLVEQIPTFPVGNELLQEATDAFALFANAYTELNHRRRELIKPDLHHDYKH